MYRPPIKGEEHNKPYNSTRKTFLHCTIIWLLLFRHPGSPIRMKHLACLLYLYVNQGNWYIPKRFCVQMKTVALTE